MRATEAQQRMLRALWEHKNPYHHVRGRSAAGGATQTMSALHRNGLVAYDPEAPYNSRITDEGWTAIGPHTCRHCLATITRVDGRWLDNRQHPETCMRALSYEHAPQTTADALTQRAADRSADRARFRAEQQARRG